MIGLRPGPGYAVLMFSLVAVLYAGDYVGFHWFYLFPERSAAWGWGFAAAAGAVCSAAIAVKLGSNERLAGRIIHAVAVAVFFGCVFAARAIGSSNTWT